MYFAELTMTLCSDKRWKKCRTCFSCFLGVLDATRSMNLWKIILSWHCVIIQPLVGSTSSQEFFCVLTNYDGKAHGLSKRRASPDWTKSSNSLFSHTKKSNLALGMTGGPGVLCHENLGGRVISENFARILRYFKLPEIVLMLDTLRLG